jgi:1-acyl-sn-glycerol-3-phosphate acyltransferase
MLLLIITVLALLGAVGAFFGGGILSGILAFIGGWIGWLILAALVLLIAVALVDKDKEEENDSKFYRTLTHLWIEFVIAVGRVKVICKGAEKLPKDGRFLLVCNHQADIDPALLMHCFPKSQLAFIGKKETKDMPIIGSMMHKLLCQYVNRENDREALKTILRCIQIVKDDKVSVGVFPEGYVSLDGKLRHFRGGVFKIAQKANVPVVVCTLRDSKKAMDRLLKLKSSQTEVHLVEVISAEEAKSMSTVELGEKIYESMIADLGEEYRTDEKGMHPDLQKKRMEQ